VAVEAVLDSADDAERPRAKEHGADDESFVEAVGVAGFHLSEAAAGVLTEAIEPFLDVQHAAGEAPERERENEQEQWQEETGDGVVEAGPGNVQAEDDGDEAHEAAPEKLRGAGELPGQHQTHEAADKYAQGIQNGARHSGQHAKTEPCGG